MDSLKNFYLSWRRRILSYKVKKRLDLSDISLISMNCIGGIVYHDCEQRFLSPTVNLYFTPDDFLKFINNLSFYLSKTPKIVMGKNYPIGELDDIKINFMHYSTPDEALSKWEERKSRINKEKIFVIMVERDGFIKKNFEDFNRINYPKLLFTKTKEYKCEDSLYMSRYKKLEQLPDIIPGRYMYSKMKLIDSINKAYK